MSDSEEHKITIEKIVEALTYLTKKPGRIFSENPEDREGIIRVVVNALLSKINGTED